MINFLAETLHDIISVNQTTDTVRHVRSIDGAYALTWSEFAMLADTSYDAGFGSAQIPSDLVVEFLDGTYLYRHEYDGSEYWKYNARLVPVQPDAKPMTKLIGRYWPTVNELHNPQEWDEDDR